MTNEQGLKLAKRMLKGHQEMLKIYIIIDNEEPNDIQILALIKGHEAAINQLKKDIAEDEKKPEVRNAKIRRFLLLP